MHLLPRGKRHGNYYEVGSVDGEPGKSLRVCMAGSRAGVWSDFSSGERGGDIFDLWMAVRGHQTLRETLEEVRGYLNLPEPSKSLRSQRREPKPIHIPEVAKNARTGALEEAMGCRGIDPDVLDAFGVSSGSNGKAMVFNYCNEKGDVLWQKSIALDRDERGKKKVWTTSDPMKILWGMQAPLNAKASRDIVITEGEIDAMSYYQQGIPAVSVPFGAKAQSTDGSSPNDEWISNCYEWLNGFDTIYLSFDMDEDGKAACDDVIDRLGRDRCRVVQLPCKDANEALVGEQSLKTALLEAKSKDPDDMTVGSAIIKRVWQKVSGGPRHLNGLVPFDWEDCEFRFRPREGTIVTGYGGHGKSNFLYQLCAWLSGRKRERVFIGSYEEPADDILGIMVRHAAGRQIKSTEYRLYKDVASDVLGNVFIHDCEDNVKIDKYFAYAEYAVKRYGCSFCVLDSLTTTDVDLDDKESVANFAQRSRVFWRTTGAHLIVVAHPRKGFDEKNPPLKPDIKGGGHLGDLFFNVVTLHRPEEGDFGRSKPDAQLVVSKQKVGGMHPWVTLNYDEGSSRLYQDISELDIKYYAEHQ